MIASTPIDCQIMCFAAPDLFLMAIYNRYTIRLGEKWLSLERSVQVKPFSEETQLERIRLQRTHPISFPKGLILLTKVRKHPKLRNESEVEAYFYRYNQTAAGYYHKKPKEASENWKNFVHIRSFSEAQGTWKSWISQIKTTLFSTKFKQFPLPEPTKTAILFPSRWQTRKPYLSVGVCHPSCEG